MFIHIVKLYVHIFVYDINYRCVPFIYVTLLHLWHGGDVSRPTRSLSQEIHDELMATDLADAQQSDLELMTLGVVG